MYFPPSSIALKRENCAKFREYLSLVMAEVEVEGSGVVEEAEESLEHVQHWDEDVVDLEFKSGHHHHLDLWAESI